MATIRAHQDQIIATQTQHTKILHQIQQHLSMQTPLQHDRSGPSEPLEPDQETIPAESPYQLRRSEQSHHMIPLLADLFIFLLAFYIRLVNPIFFMFYKLGLDVLLDHHALYISFPSNIYIYILFYYILFSHYSFVFGTCGLRYSIPPIHSDFVSLRRYHFLPLFLIVL